MGELIHFIRGLNKEASDLRKKGSVGRKTGSPYLYVRFPYRGMRIEKSTGLIDNEHNRNMVREWLDHIFDMIDQGTFRFAEAFPGASEEEKRYFSRLEGRQYGTDPSHIYCDDYLEHWVESVLPRMQSETKRHDYASDIESRIRDFFNGKTFADFNGHGLMDFVNSLTHESGPKTGKPLSPSRIKNLLSKVKRIYQGAAIEYNFPSEEPFTEFKALNAIYELIPERERKPPEVFLPSEWILLMDHMDEYYRPICELMILTGMIHSEIAGLSKKYIYNNKIHVRESITRKRKVKNKLKTKSRSREIPITKAIGQQLEIGIKRAKDHPEDEPIFTMKSGIPYDGCNFRKNDWTRAFGRAGFEYKIPYTLRHTFAAWALITGMEPLKLVSLMGHRDKEMVYGTYADYREGLELQKGAIKEYFGDDFK